MEKGKRKELLNAYKARTVTGGVYRITCAGNGRSWLRHTTDMDGAKSRYGFSVKIGCAPEPAMLREFNQYGIASFSFTVLEELEKKESQTDREFADDVRALLAMWEESEEPRPGK